MPPPTSTISRKRTRSPNASENSSDHEHATSTSTNDSPQLASRAPSKRQRNHPPSRTNYSLRNRSITSDDQHSSTRLPSLDASTSSQRYNLRPRHSQSQVHSSQASTQHPTSISHLIRRQISTSITDSAQQDQSTSSTVQPRQYRLVYISDDDDQPTTSMQPSTAIVNTTFDLVTDDEDDELIRPSVPPRRTARSTANTGQNTR